MVSLGISTQEAFNHFQNVIVMRSEKVVYSGATSGICDFLNENSFQANGTGIFEQLSLMAESPQLEGVNPVDKASLISDNQHEMSPIPKQETLTFCQTFCLLFFRNVRFYASNLRMLLILLALITSFLMSSMMYSMGDI